MKTLSALSSLALAGTVCANPIDQIRPDAPALAPYGMFPVGVQTRSVSIPEAIDILGIDGNAVPTYDRPLTLEIWYPAAEGTEPGGTYVALMRDGRTEINLTGRASRNAEPSSQGRFPLILISHGYPGNRYLMSHLGENLASKGYVTVSIDHTDSLYSDQAAFGSTLYNRPLDQRFVIDWMSSDAEPLAAITDAQTTGLIGYSMGGYGALIFAGAGVTQASTEYPWGTPNGLLERHLAGSEEHEALMDERLRAIIAIGPWGRNTDFWDAEGAAGLRKPMMMMAGSADDVSVYEAMRSFFDEATGSDRHLLTFENANHNAAAPMPAPVESWEMVEGLDFPPFAHYADAVWDSTRMNNIAQHFATAFFDQHLKGIDRAAYFDLLPNAADGVHDLDDAGKPTETHTYWNGFPARSALGLRFESKKAGE